MATRQCSEVAVIPVNDVHLEALVVRPANHLPNAFAVIAHPYGPLGGSMHDSVVQCISRVFLDLRISTVVYNSRGVGESSGRASWSGWPEERDYQGVVRWAQDRLIGHDHESLQPASITVYCCGYSYGSLMAASASTCGKAAADERFMRRYILVSPPVGVAWLLTPFRTNALVGHMQDIVRARRLDTSRCPSILIIYGDRDNFTSVKSYRAWVARLYADGEELDGGFELAELEGCDHFWPEPGRQEMLNRVRAFVSYR